MSFGGGGGGSSSIAASTDAALSNPAGGDMLGYDSAVAKWRNSPITGTVALANNGGKEAVNFLGTTTGSVTIDLSTANVFSTTLGGDVTLNFTGATSGYACSFALYVLSGTGGHSITWPTSIKWENGTAPTLTATGGRVDIFVFETITGGTTWYGFISGQNFS